MPQALPDINLMKKLYQISPPPAPNLSDQLHKPCLLPAPNMMEISQPPPAMSLTEILTMKNFYQFLMYPLLGMNTNFIAKYKSEISFCCQENYLELL